MDGPPGLARRSGARGREPVMSRRATHPTGQSRSRSTPHPDNCRSAPIIHSRRNGFLGGGGDDSSEATGRASAERRGATIAPAPALKPPEVGPRTPWRAARAVRAASRRGRPDRDGLAPVATTPVLSITWATTLPRSRGVRRSIARRDVGSSPCTRAIGRSRSPSPKAGRGAGSLCGVIPRSKTSLRRSDQPSNRSGAK
jgi:hypothetical protein